MIDPNAIIRTTCNMFEVSERDLCCKALKRRWTLPRHVAMYLLWMLTPMAMHDVGKRIGSRKRAAVQHAVRRIMRELKTSSEMAMYIDAITLKVTALAA